MPKAPSVVVMSLLAASLSTLAPASRADEAIPLQATSTVVSLNNVTWSLTNPGGVGTFRVTVGSSGALRAGSVWAQASSAGAPTVQGAIGAAKPGGFGNGDVRGTANGRCYVVKLAVEPDSSSLGIKLDPKNSSRKVCLDPDGKGIIP